MISKIEINFSIFWISCYEPVAADMGTGLTEPEFIIRLLFDTTLFDKVIACADDEVTTDAVATDAADC